jgi:hypothetical protein
MAVAKGLALAAVNVLVIAIGIAIAGESVLHLRGRDVVTAIIAYGSVPGLLTGAVLGWLGQVLEARDPRLRMLVLTALAISVVVVLGATFELPRYIAPACLPTIAGALALERWTRKRPVPPIPLATANSMPGASRID